MLSKFQDQGRHNACISLLFTPLTMTPTRKENISVFGAATIKISRSVSLQVSAETGKAAPLRNNPSTVNRTF